MISAAVVAIAQQPGRPTEAINKLPPPDELWAKNAMTNPYQLIPSWPHLGGLKLGPANGIVPDGKGGVWLQHRGEPAILHFDASGNIIKRFEVKYDAAHGLCLDPDGNFWALDSGQFYVHTENGNRIFKYSPEGKLLMTIGQAGVAKAGRDTFMAPTACKATPDGNMIIADGHWPRPVKEMDDRLVWYTKDGKFIKEYGRHGRKPGEFMGIHGLAFDSRGRLFVADRSNNRIQIFDKDMNIVDEWRHFGRPSNLWILKDDTLIVSDSESNHRILGPDDAPDGPGLAVRNPGWKNGIWIGSAKDGSIKYFIEGTRPEGLAADELGNIFGGITMECENSPAGGCLEKYVRKAAK
jgi:sugar lactone lactonase YvrE